jgi:hypothetical protein
MTTDHTTLAAWLPILQHPEVGERICKAAGVRYAYGNLYEKGAGIGLWPPDDGGFVLGETLSGAFLAALAFGALAVMDDDGHEVPDHVTGMGNPSNVLAAAKRLWCE